MARSDGCAGFQGWGMRCLVLACALQFVTGCAGPVQAAPAAAGQQAKRHGQPRSERGRASYYAAKHHGKPTASGERFDMHALTAAHRTLPFGTYVRVTSLTTGKSIIVRINDRGPFGDRRRIIDVSHRAAQALDLLRLGVDEVRVEVVSKPRETR